MDLKVGDRVRIRTITEMSAINSQDFFGRDFFKKWGNHKFVIIKVADGLLGKKYKINVNDDWESYYISSSAVEKINNFNMELDKNLFEL